MRATKPTVTTTASVIASGDESHPQTITVSVPAAGQTVFLGGSDVTAATGFPVATGTALPGIVVDGPLYAIVAATTQAVDVLAPGSN